MRVSTKIMRTNKYQKIPCLVFQYESKQIVFNTPEDTQRYLPEFGLRFKENCKIFMTGNKVDHLSGYKSVYLMLQERNALQMTQVYGSTDAIKTLQSYYDEDIKKNFNNSILVSMASLSRKDPLNIKALKNEDLLRKILQSKLKQKIKSNPQEVLNSKQIPNGLMNVAQDFLFEDCDLIKATKNNDDSDDNDRTTFTFKEEEARIIGIPLQENDSQTSSSMAYIIIFDKSEAKVCTTLLKKFGVGKRQIKTLIQEGKIDKQKLGGGQIFLEDVLKKVGKGPAFLIVDCPNISQIEQLTKSKDIDRLLINNDKEASNYFLSSVFHLGSKEVIDDSVYQKWISNFGDEAVHVFTSPEFDGLSDGDSKFEKKQDNFVKDQKLQKLREMDEQLFSSYYNYYSEDNEDETCEIFKKLKKMKNKIQPYRHGLEIMSHDSSNNRSRVQIIDDLNQPKNSKPKNTKIENINYSYYQSQQQQQQQKTKSSDPKNLNHFPDYPEIVMLGTASKMPGATRGVTSVLLNYGDSQSRKSIIMDCGEGSINQLYSKYTPEEVESILKSLQVIFVSHTHEDHNLGLLSLLAERSKITDQPITVTCPSNCEYLIDLARQHYKLPNIEYIDVADVRLYNEGELVDEKVSEFMENLRRGGIPKFQPVPVEHCYLSHGLVMKGQTGWKLTFGGDCRPSKTLIQEGMESDILIHESTYLPGQEEEAKRRQHSTLKQAGKVALEMKAKSMIVTHFSQSIVNSLSQEVGLAKNYEIEEYLSNHVIYSEDLLRVDINDTSKAQKFTWGL